MSVFEALGKAAPNRTLPYKTLYERVLGGALALFEKTYEGGKVPGELVKSSEDERKAYEISGARRTRSAICARSQCRPRRRACAARERAVDVFAPV